jgi:hypothetical protein
MIPTTREIVWRIRAISELYPKDTVSEIAAKLGLSPIFIINALDEGEQLEWFQRKRDKKGAVTEVLEILLPINWGIADHDNTFGPDHRRIRDEIVCAITNANKEEQDIDLGTLMAWCRGINPSAVEIVLESLTKLNVLGAYDLADPKDVKSIYTFYSLKGNATNQWGTKQFKAKKAKN